MSPFVCKTEHLANDPPMSSLPSNVFSMLSLHHTISLLAPLAICCILWCISLLAMRAFFNRCMLIIGHCRPFPALC